MSRLRYVALDRDGTLIEDRVYLSDPEGVRLLPGAAEALKRFRARGLRVALITNQSGVGRGRFTMREVEAVHARLQALLAAEGAELDGIWICPHAPEEGCLCRKPGVALLEAAASAFGCPREAGAVIGDKACDIEMGRRAGCPTCLVRTGSDTERAAALAANPDRVADGMAEAAAWVEDLLG